MIQNSRYALIRQNFSFIGLDIFYDSVLEKALYSELIRLQFYGAIYSF